MASTTSYGAAQDRVLALCRSGAADRELRVDLLEVIRRVVGFDAYAWLLTDPETSVGSSPLADVPFLPDLPRAIRLKYLTTVNRWTALDTPAALLSAATGGDLSQSVMWRELLCHHRVTDTASSVYRDRFGCWGFLELWRSQPAEPFTPQQASFLAGIAGSVTQALRRSQARTFAEPAADSPGLPGPLVLLLSPDLAVQGQTPSTQPYLRILVPAEPGGGAPVPAGAYNVAAQLLANEAGVDRNPPMARVHYADGAWLTMKAGRLEGSGSGHAPGIAVSIEPASPSDRAAVFARSAGLSARETELLHHLIAGADTRAIARLMHLSENTVQDHLKSVFAKTGTRSRAALVSRALGS